MKKIQKLEAAAREWAADEAFLRVVGESLPTWSERSPASSIVSDYRAANAKASRSLKALLDAARELIR